MQKIKSLFKRDYEGNGQAINEVESGSEWVINGEGVATRKWDGTCCKVEGGELFKRYDAKKGKIPPAGFMPAQEPDEITGHWPGWVAVGEGPEDKWFREAYAPGLPDGTYELIGPKVNGNKDNSTYHYLVPHGQHFLPDAPRTFEGLKKWLDDHKIEGIVWHHPDGRMVKIKRKDFGYKW